MDLESFAAGGNEEGLAGTSGVSRGEQSSVNSETQVHAGTGSGSSSFSSGSGSASGQGISSVDLESFAALENQGEISLSPCVQCGPVSMLQE